MGASHSIKSDSLGTTQPPSASSSSAVVHRQGNLQRVQNVVLVWLDSSIENSDDQCQNTVTQLRQVVNEINIFSDADRCIEFIEEIKDNKVCMIISGALGEHTVRRVHGMSQVDSIFIFCRNKKYHEGWAKDWSKIKGVFTAISPICEALKQASKQCEQDAIPISFVATTDGASNKNINQLEPSFMYTGIMKKILFTIQFDQKHFEEFIEHCRDQFSENEKELNFIEKLEKTYRDKTPIWWYTHECFLYPMVNSSLRAMDGDIIIKMGFFINALHRQIEQLHSKQFGSRLVRKIFTVYRGQGLPIAIYEKMNETQGGLMSFNNFLSTSKKRNVSMKFARNALSNPGSVGILFVMIIDPAQSTTPFASVNHVASYGKKEDEVLFSMHSVFRVGSIQRMSENDRLYQVNLTLTSDNDEDLHQLTDRVEQETFPEEKGWYRLGSVLMKMGQPKKAEEVFAILLDKSDNESERGPIYHNIGMAKRAQGEYQEAIKFYEKAVKIYKRALASNLPNLAKSYNNIGAVYNNIGDYPKALLYCEKAVLIEQQSLPPTYPELAVSYNNIGNVHKNMGDCHKALFYYEKARSIQQQSLSSNHPDLAASCNTIGSLYKTMGDYSNALSSYEQALTIRQLSLPSNHPDLAGSYNNIGNAHKSMGDYSQALTYYKKALEIRQESLQPFHPDLAASYNNIGLLHETMSDYPKALSYYEKALVIHQQSLPPKHPDLARSYISIAMVHYEMSAYPKALSYYEKALAIQQLSLPSNHPDLAMSYTNIGLVYKKMGAQ